MSASPIRTVEMLKHEIEKTKQTLVETDETIKRITGREAGENRPIRNNNNLHDRRLSRDQRFEGRTVLGLNRKRMSGGLLTDRQTSRNYGEIEEEFEKSKMSVASSVVVTRGATKSREDIIEQQHLDKEGNARNKRMFGLLMGTLQSFKADGSKNEQLKKRREIERRVEEREKNEKENARKERVNLFSSKKENQVKLRRLQLKMDVVQLHEEWEEQSKQLTNFIRTDNKPNIYYLPKVHTKSSLENLEKSKKLIEAVVAKRRKLLDEELKNILEGKKDDEEDEDDDAPPRKQSKKESVEENEAESENEIDKNISDDFQISAATDVIVNDGGDAKVDKNVETESEQNEKEETKEEVEKEKESVNEDSDDKIVEHEKENTEEEKIDNDVKNMETDKEEDENIRMDIEVKRQSNEQDAVKTKDNSDNKDDDNDVVANVIKDTSVEN